MSENTYQEITFGHDEPNLMFCSGKHVKWLGESLGNPVTHDAYGQPILDGEVYMISPDGIFLMEFKKVGRP